MQEGLQFSCEKGSDCEDGTCKEERLRNELGQCDPVGFPLCFHSNHKINGATNTFWN